MSSVPRTLDTTDWTTYASSRYGFDIAYPPGWSLVPADHDWTMTEARDFMSKGHEAFNAPGRDVRVSAWSVPVDSGKTPEGSAVIEAWITDYCERSGNAPCTGVHERAVPLCAERRDCHPGLLVGFADDVQAFFPGTLASNAGRMVVVAVWWGESAPAVAPYGGSRRLLKGFLSTMYVWPAP